MHALTLFLALIFVSSDLFAAAEPYGLRFYLEVAGPREQMPHTEPALSKADTEALSVSVAQLQAAVERRELEGGPYAAGLAESLGDLARSLEALGKTDEAMSARERALHLLRVNEGLYSPAQAPLVRAMLDSLRAQGDFGTLDQRYDYFFRLFGAGRKPWSEVRWSALLEYLRWQREALNRNLEGGGKERLYETYRLTDELLDGLRLGLAEGSADWTRLRDLVQAQLALFHLIEERVQPLQDFPVRRGAIPPRDPRANFDLLQERLENLQRSIRQRGGALLEEVLASVPAGDHSARAKVLLDLGDWYLWHGAQADARRFYLAVWTELSGRQDELLRAWFDQPVPLPANGAFQLENVATTEAAERRYTLDVSVTSIGRARARRASNGDPVAPQRLRRQVNNTRFRPVMKDAQFTARDWANLVFVLVER